jgi:large subunit ribosomal protein L9
MNVILKDKVENLGMMGDLVRVSEGYARNFLLPRGLAAIANKKEVAQVEHQKRALKKKLLQLKSDMEAQKSEVEKQALVFRRKVGESGKLFGSITTQDISDALKEKGISLDRRMIQLEGTLKKLGKFEIPARLMEGVVANLNVSVVADVE